MSYLIDVSFNSILNNNSEKQFSSISCQEIETNDINNVCSAQENDIEIQGK